jgi:(p)ppGpp synthase/HD superfamily hydrolase
VKYVAAVAYAIGAHGDQKRIGSSYPYVAHPIAVSTLVIEDGGSEDQAIAGLLHDVLENCGEQHAGEIEVQLGAGVIETVKAMTDGVSGATGRKPALKERKEA